MPGPRTPELETRKLSLDCVSWDPESVVSAGGTVIFVGVA